MQEHLIPQDITNYRFHLIGELDLKQFLEILAGVGIAALIYATNLPGIIKWPIMMVFVGAGLMAAFVPINDQPLSHWVKVFIRNLSAPTKFYWKKNENIPRYFSFELKPEYKGLVASDLEINYSPAKKLRAKDYFSTIETTVSTEDPLELFDGSNLDVVMTNFQEVKVPEIIVTKQVVKPAIKTTQSVRTRQMVVPTEEDISAFLDNSSIFTPKKVTTTITDVDHQAVLKNAIQDEPSPLLQTPSGPTTPVTSSPPPAQAVSPTPPDQAPSATPVSSLINTSNENLTNATTPTPTAPLASATTTPISNPSPTTDTPAPVSSAVPTASTVATSPHAISGQVLDAQGNPLDGAIVSVRDIHNNIKSLARSNSAGKFSTPGKLAADQYIITTQKDNLLFPEISYLSSNNSDNITIKAEA